MTASDEQVLVIPAARLEEAGVGRGLCCDVERCWPILLDPSQFAFLPRAQAEDDPSFKQLIPYVVLKHCDQVFAYTRGRAGSEKRLHELRSIGIGGHINPCDMKPGEHPYLAGMQRELREEIVLGAAFRNVCIGFIYDDSTPVGQVHLGVVHLFELSEPKVTRRETQLTQAGFAPIADLARNRANFETWSQFVLDYLRER
jgi:predicted NUDIX family phosphoesterase